MKVQLLNCKDIYPSDAIQPRDMLELEGDSLRSEVLRDGRIDTPIHVVRIDPGFKEAKKLALHNILTNEQYKVEEVLKDDSIYVPMRGHRRLYSSTSITTDESLPAEIRKSFEQIPAIVIPLNTLAEMKAYALDANSQEQMKSWEIVRIIMERYRAGESPREVAVDIPRLVYQAFLKNGDSLFNQDSRIVSASDRNEKYCTRMSNYLETQLHTVFKIGNKEFHDTFVNYWRYHIDKRPSPEGGAGLHVNLKMQLFQKKLRKAWTPIGKDPKLSRGYVKVSKTGAKIIEGEKRKEPFVEGGIVKINDEVVNTDIRDALLEAIDEYVNGIKPEQDVSRPSADKVKEVLNSVESSQAKDWAAWALGEEADRSKILQADIAWTLAERRQEVAESLKLHPMLAKVVNVLFHEENMDTLMTILEDSSQDIVDLENSIDGLVDTIEKPIVRRKVSARK